VQCIWRREGLKVTRQAKTQGTVVAGEWFACAAEARAGESCLELRLCRCHDARWKDASHSDADRRVHPEASLALRVARRLNSLEVIDTLADVMLGRGIPEHLRSDNGPEFMAHELQNWLAGGNTNAVTSSAAIPGRTGVLLRDLLESCGTSA
jgi:putative transposase